LGQEPHNCSPFGDAHIYILNYCNDAPPEDTAGDGSVSRSACRSAIPGGGLLPPLVPVVIEIPPPATDGSSNTEGKIRKGMVTGMNVIPAGAAKDVDNKKTYWYTEQGD
jgi:hypothetical protein